MNIYDEASKLAGKIRESKEYKEYKKLKENIESNPIKKAQVEEFEHLRYKIQVMAMQGNSDASESKQILQEKYAELLKDEEIKKYFDSEPAPRSGRTAASSLPRSPAITATRSTRRSRDWRSSPF